MKRIADYIKPNILIIFGALLLIFYLDFLSLTGAALALGIVAIIMSIFYIVWGVALVLTGNKLSASTRKLFETLSVSLFAFFMFIYFLLQTINAAGAMGPTDWVVNILSMVASLALGIVYITYQVADKNLVRFVSLLALIFVLALLLDVLFNAGGTLGGINVFLVAIYSAYSFYLFSSLGKIEKAPKQADEKE